LILFQDGQSNISFNAQIIENINNQKLDYFSLNQHINYALENRLIATYKKIEELILDDDQLYFNNNYLKNFAELLSKMRK